MRYFILIKILLLTLGSIGLRSQNIWEPTNGPVDLRTTDLFIDKLDRLFAIDSRGNQFRYSLDKGKTWYKLGWPANAFGTSVDLVSSNTGNLFLRVDDKLYLSDNLGLSWIDYSIPGISKFIGIAGNNDHIICVTGSPKSAFSSDGGMHWNPIATPVLSFSPNLIFIHPDGSIILTHQDYFQRILPEFEYSEDNGLHWVRKFLNFYNIFSMTISKSGTFYLSAYSSTTSSDEILFSNDKLQSFGNVKPSSYYRTLISDSKENLYLADGSECIKSSNAGSSWEPFESGLPANRFATFLAVDADQYLYLAFDDDVVYKTMHPVSELVSTNQKYKTSEMEWYPNPVDDKLIVKLSGNDNSLGCYKVINLDGAVILNGEFHSNQFTVDCASLPNGMAYIQVFGADKFYCSEKIVVVH